MVKKTVPIDINEALQELETIVEKIEDADLSLEESIKEFERGIGLVRQAQETLNNAEQRVLKLLEGEKGKPKITKFEFEEDFEESE